MKKTMYKLASLLMLSVIGGNLAFAQSDTTKTGSDSAQISRDSLANMTQEELNAYVDSVYWAGRKRPKVVWHSDTARIDTLSPKMRSQSFSYSNSYVPNSVTVNTSKAVGQIDIQPGISPTGAKTYTIPIKGYKFDGVFCPDISLTYNSQGGGSAYGKGWSIGGLQCITRGNKSIYYDNQTGGMKMNADDVFYLNGVRLIRVSNSTYEYETEKGHIKAIATTSGSVVKYFNVFYPNGYKAVFGMTSTTNNKLEYPITTLMDERGRNIYYNYISYYNTYNISYIEYDGNNARISFTYDQTRADYVQGYRGGLQLDSRYLLKSITCSRNSTTLNTYTLTYTTNGGTSLLTQLDFSANGSSLNPLKFYYGDGTAELAYDSGAATLLDNYDFSDRHDIIATRGRFDYNSGNEGLLCYSNVNPYVHVQISGSVNGHSRNYFTNMYTDDDHCLIYSTINEGQNNTPLSFVLGDEFITALTAVLDSTQQESVIRINNVVIGSNDVVTAQIYKKLGSTMVLKYTRTYTYQTVYTDASGNKSYKPKFYYTGDFDGDGRMDLMVLTSTNPFGETGNPSTCYIYDLEKNQTLYSGQLLVFEKQFQSIGDISYSAIGAENLSDKVFPFDYDGDGKTDLCHIHSTGVDIYTFSKSGNSLIGQQVGTTYTGLWRNYLQNKFYSVGEFNGDGLMDIIVSAEKNVYGSSYWDFYYSKGDATFATGVTNQGPNTQYSTSDFVIQDIDGDGVTDLVEVKDDEFKTYLVKNGQMSNGGTKSFTNSGELLIPVNINSSTLCTPLVGILSSQATLYTYKTNRRTGQALTGMANSNGVVEKNYYYQINNSDTYNIYSQGTVAISPYSHLFEAIPLLAGNELFKGGTSADINKYFYYNAIAHRQGLGFRGFGYVKVTDKHTRDFITFYDPFKYSVVSSVRTPLSTTYYTTTASVANNMILTILVNSKEEYNNLTGVRTITSYTYDQYGLVLTENTSFTNSNITVGKEYTYTHFTNIANKYHLGLLATATTATSRGSSTHTEQTSITSYNTNDQPLNIINKVNGNTVKTTVLTYDTNGNVTQKDVKPFSSTTARTWTYQYTTGNRMTKETDPVGVWNTYSYNADGTVNTVGSFVGNTVYTYDAFGRVTKEQMNDGSEINTAFTWNTENGGLYAVTRSGTAIPTSSAIYDALNREVRTKETRFNNTQLMVDKAYDQYGNLASESLPYKGSSPLYNTYTYDYYDRLTEKNEASGKTTAYTYNNLSTTVSDGTMYTTKTTDVLGALVSSTDPAGTITYTLNGAGNPVTISTPASSGTINTSFTYDTYGRKKTITDPSHGVTRYNYGTDGHLQSEVNAKLQIISYTYDNKDRLTTKTTPEFTTTYAYNDTLNVLRSVMSTNGTSTTYSYDSYGRLSTTKETAPDSKWLQKNYSYTNGRVSAIQYTSQSGTLGTENYIYAYGHLSEVKLNNSASIFKMMSENAMGLTTQVTTGNLTRNYGYTAYGLPSARVVLQGSTNKSVINYTYNTSTGNLTSLYYPLKSKTENFTYDNLYRLTSYGSTAMSYDDNGNILSKGDVGTFTYGTTGKPYAISQATLSNSISVGTQTATYVSFDRPSTVTDNGYTLSFTYNGDYDRMKMTKVKNSQTQLTRYYLGGCYELDVKSTGSTEKLYLNGGYYGAPAVLIKQGGNSSVYNIIRDHLGSITHVLNSSGTVMQELSYDAWGRLRNTSTFTPYAPYSEPEPYLGRGYCGHEHLTGLGLINMNARLYDPVLGRFLMADPYIQAPDMTQNFNRYSYCLNNPLKYSDITGEWFGIDDLIACAVGGVVNLGVNLISGDIHSFGQGVASFFLGAAAGEVALYGQAEISALLVGAGNSIINQGFTNGWNNIRWGDVAIAGGMSVAFSTLGGEISSLYSNQVDQFFGGISNEVLRKTLSSGTVSSLTGFTLESSLTLANGGSLSDALNAGLQGAGTGFVSGALNGFGTGIREARHNKTSPWTGEKTHRHHSDPKFMEGDPKQKLTTMSESRHIGLHSDLNEHLYLIKDNEGNHMRPQRGNNGINIRNNFSRPQRIAALKSFYDSHPFKYWDARYDFYRNNHLFWLPW